MSQDDADSDRSGRFTARLRGVLRRKGAIAVILLPAFTIGGLVAYLSPPRFTATAVIRIDSSSAATPKARLPASERESLAATHAALVVDPDLARVVIDDLELSPKSLLKPVSLRHLVERKISRVLSRPVSQGARDPIRAYLSRLEARAVPGTHLVHIAFTSANPALSARIANAHAHAYIELALARRFGAGEGARDFLTARLEEARGDVEVATAALDDYRAKYDLAAIGVKSQAISRRLAEDNRQMLEAEAERVRLASQIELVRQGKYDALPAVTGSDAVWRLKERLASLEARRLRLQADFRPDSQEVAAIEAQLQGLRTELGAEIDSIVAGIDTSYAAARSAEEAARTQLEEQRGRALSLESAVTRFTSLERVVERSRSIHANLGERRLAMDASSELYGPTITLVQDAQAPLGPSAPHRPMAVALSLLLGVTGGLSLAFFREVTDPALSTPQQVELQLGMPALGALPDFRQLARAHDDRTPGSARSWDPESAFAADEDDDPEIEGIRRQGLEAFREIRTRILISTPAEPPCALLFTGASRGAGTTSVALNIAAVLSRLRKPVLVIDADLREPRCHEVLDADNDIGLSDVLAGRADPSEAIQRVTEHLALLPAGPTPTDPTELLASTEMAECLIELQKHFAYIVVDGPPLDPTSDSLVLSPLFDGVVLVADQPSSVRQALGKAAKSLHRARARTLGIVMNRAPYLSVPNPDLCA